jgi:hypothetical protein
MDYQVFSSGMSRRADFAPALAANHSIGIDVQEMSANAIAQLAVAMASSTASVFVDSGAFGHFRAAMRGDERKAIDFAAVFDKYDAIACAVSQADPDGYAADRLHFVMPDVVGNQVATIELWRAFAARFHSARAIVPLQAGELSLVELYDVAAEILGSDMLDVGIPSKAEAVSAEQFAELLAERGDCIFSLHILGAASAKAVAPRLAVIEAAGYDGPVSADANRLRSIWKPDRGVSRAQALHRLIGAAPVQFSFAEAA